MNIHLDKHLTRNLAESTRREWLETNGLGGWASSTLSGMNTRRYHGLLVAATHPPVGRQVIIAKLDETVRFENKAVELGSNQFPGTVHPQGYRYLVEFRKDFFPQFLFQIGEIQIRKTILTIHGENTTVVMYEVLEAPFPFTLELRPFVSGRDYHHLLRANPHAQPPWCFDKAVFESHAPGNDMEYFISAPGCVYVHQPDWYYRFEYAVERERGLDYQEDLFTPGTFRVMLGQGKRLALILSTDNPLGRDALALYDQEKRRREALLNCLPHRDNLTTTLTLAADQFLVRRGENHTTVIAGYHWFSDWGRDTMISLPGLCLVTGNQEKARDILESYIPFIDQGMLPNRFPDNQGESPEYNTIDASLWFFVAAYQYWKYSGDVQFLRNTLWEALQEIIAWHRKGTRYRIHEDRDGLLYGGEPGVQLTWMDAKVGDWVVTPRIGKPVEINALWYNAHRIMAEFAHHLDLPKDASLFEQKAQNIQKIFNRKFWNKNLKCLYDVLGDDGADDRIRPNQIFALSLPFPLLSITRLRSVLKVVEAKLLTPFGLRTLAPDDQEFRGQYRGGVLERDGAYHQGTVWAWLLGPYITALIRVRGKKGRQQAERILKKFQAHLTDAGVGTISEIFDATPPFTPRGCIAQAWSVAEILRAYLEDVLNIRPKSG